jgi:hypothetical protein
VECAVWEGRAQQRDAEVRQVGKETDKGVKYNGSSVKPLANTSRKAILLESGNIRAIARPRGKYPMGD